MANPRRTYSIDEANGLVPEVRAVLLQLSVEQRRLRGPSHDEAHAGIDALLGHLADLGVQVRDLQLGLVDFPAERDGRPVWLCWRLADPAVAFWHGTDEGYASRKAW